MRFLLDLFKEGRGEGVYKAEILTGHGVVFQVHVRAYDEEEAFKKIRENIVSNCKILEIVSEEE